MLQMKEDFDVSDHIYDTFINEILKPIKYEKGTLYIEVPEDGYIYFLQNRLISQIRVAIAHSIKIPIEDLEIVFITKNTPLKKIKNENEDFDMLLKTSGVSEPKNTFENFVKGSSNALAYATSIAIAENPGENYNPLFIYGKTGLGKTHLMQAIAIYILKKDRDKNVLFTNTEKFTDEFVTSIRKNKISDFKNKFRSVDVLLVDDIHSLKGKPETQEEFFNTFNALYDNKKQIVLTSDRPLIELEGVDERLISRFAWGTTCDVGLPDYETRIAILRKKEQIIRPEYPVDNEVVKFIAKNVKTNIRELESALNNIICYSKLANKTINLELAKERLGDIQKKEEKKITPSRITTVVCEYFGLNMLDVCGKKRNREFVYARDIAIFLCREMLKDITQEKIGEFFGGRDHSTIINSCSKLESKLKHDKELEENLKSIREMLLI